MDNSITFMTSFQNYPDRELCAKGRISYRILYNYLRFPELAFDAGATGAQHEARFLQANA